MSLRRLFPRRRRSATEADERQESELPDEIAEEFTTEELMEFLEADHADVTVDPEFRERLREKLWEIVRARSARDEE